MLFWCPVLLEIVFTFYVQTSLNNTVLNCSQLGDSPFYPGKTTYGGAAAARSSRNRPGTPYQVWVEAFFKTELNYGNLAVFARLHLWSEADHAQMFYVLHAQNQWYHVSRQCHLTTRIWGPVFTFLYVVSFWEVTVSDCTLALRERIKGETSILICRPHWGDRSRPSLLVLRPAEWLVP